MKKLNYAMSGIGDAAPDHNLSQNWFWYVRCSSVEYHSGVEYHVSFVILLFMSYFISVIITIPFELES